MGFGACCMARIIVALTQQFVNHRDYICMSIVHLPIQIDYLKNVITPSELSKPMALNSNCNPKDC